MRHRNHTDIVAQILEAAGDGTRRTTIMYKCFLPFNQLTEYLWALEDNGLLEHVPTENKYRISQKGEEFLAIYKNSEELDTSNNAESIPR